MQALEKTDTKTETPIILDINQQLKHYKFMIDIAPTNPEWMSLVNQTWERARKEGVIQ
jgi:hypothetical protein